MEMETETKRIMTRSRRSIFLNSQEDKVQFPSCPPPTTTAMIKDLQFQTPSLQRVNLRTIFHSSLLFLLIFSSFPKLSESRSRGERAKNGIFIQVPYSNPPTVRPPPYSNSREICPAINVKENWVGTLCGDLNRGFIPTNPLKHKFEDGSNYPFDIIKNKTLEFFRQALPVLKNDKSLPKVAKTDFHHLFPTNNYRIRRDVSILDSSPSSLSSIIANSSSSSSSSKESVRQGRILNLSDTSFNRLNLQNHGRFCDNPSNSLSLSYYSRICRLYNAMWGKTPHSYQRHDTSNENKFQNQKNYGGGGGVVNNGQGHQQQNILQQQHLQQQQQQFNGNNNNLQPAQSQNYNHYRPTPISGFPHNHNNPNPTNSNQQPQLQHQLQHQLSSKPTSFFDNPTKKVKSTPSGADNMPATICPSMAEYITPVFARNHEGDWRYVVQIPKEGYFTQTVEVTKCLQSSCFYIDGSCRSSPRWQSLLVAEMYYPNAIFPTTTKAPSVLIASTLGPTTNPPHPPPVSDFNRYQQYLYKRATDRENELNSSFNIETRENEIQDSLSSGKCDGYDQIGCFQVRLFFDWFLVPNQCKCFKNFDIFR